MKTCIHPALFQDMLLLVDWIVWRIFCWHILGPLIPSEQCLNATVLHGITMSISFWLQFPHFLINGEIYHKAEIISNHFKKAWRHLTSKLTRCHSISPRLRCGGWKICIVEVKPTNLHSAIWSVCLTHLVNGPKSLRDEIWASQFCIKNRGSINEAMKCLKRLPPFLHFCGNIWHYNLKMGCN